jgi:hypothetical protein
MTDKTKQTLSLVLTALLAACGALVALDGIPAKLHQVAVVLLAIGGSVGTALLPGVAVPPKAPEAKQ